MTRDEIGNAIRAFHNQECPACGTKKARRIDPFCSECSELLPEELRDGIASRETYLETFKPAMDHLGSRRTPAFDSGPEGESSQA